ncbi:MAG TPA: phosphate--AMP phosphotransferase [Planctomycetota bacterium]|nr:phosphate--AMP phosphotransferase [Planctomycetota bacterium]
MLEKLDLSRKVSKADYKKAKDGLDLRLAALQRKVKDLKIPVIILFEGWDAAGKGTLINELILPLDPRGFNVYSTLPPTEEESLHPFLWRFWPRTPARGRIAIFDRSWYRRVLGERVDGRVKGRALQQAYEDITSFERLLANGGNVIIKFFLHISRKEQKRRFEKLEGNPATAWRVTKADWRDHKRYDKHLAAAEDMLAGTDADFAPWTVVESHNQRFATLKIFETVVEALERRVAAAAPAPKVKAAPAPAAPAPALPEALKASILDGVDMSPALDQDAYRKRLKKAQARVRELEYEIYRRRVGVVLAFEGWDAAGKGGNIRRLTQNLDPRGYTVIPIAAPNDIEKAHHYLWRFWTEMPKAGHIAIFDRSWYGRVLVERVEGFCAEGEWKRAYREINDMEHHLANSGVVVRKFWLQITKEEQLRRFKERQRLAYKRWKITEEDWRNREKWDLYKAAVEEMLFRTSTPYAPWIIVEANCKWYARIKVLDTVIEGIEDRLKA